MTTTTLTFFEPKPFCETSERRKFISSFGLQDLFEKIILWKSKLLKKMAEESFRADAIQARLDEVKFDHFKLHQSLPRIF